MHRSRNLCAWSAAIVAAALAYGSASAQIATDNSFGPAQALSGPAFSIDHALGKLRGNNLFHSFDTFNLEAGQSATFTGPSNLANIVARVTGGSSSSIDGTLATQTGGTPSLFLVNPAGIIFGPNAELNVEGSFYVSTADYLRFADGAKLLSKLGDGSTFSTAEPAAFGFLTANPAALTITESVLNVGLGSTLNIVGGELHITAGWLAAPGGTIAAAAVASAGEVAVDPSTSEQTTVESFGNASFLPLPDYSLWPVLDSSDYSGAAPSGGNINLRAGALKFEGAIWADNYGSGAGGTIALEGQKKVEIGGSSITGYSFADGSTASIELSGGDITVDRGWILTDAWGSTAGSIAIKANSLTVESSRIESAGSFGGKSGDVTIEVAGALVMSGDLFGPIADGIFADDITIRADAVNLGSQIAGNDIVVDVDGAFTIGSQSIVSAGVIAYVYEPIGDVGSISIDAGSITIESGGQISSATFSDSHGPSVNISADSLFVAAGGFISSSTYGNGVAGDISVDVTGALSIIGDPVSMIPAGIVANLPNNEFAFGVAGMITINADNITIADGGEISSQTFGLGDGGDVRIHAAQTLDIKGNGIRTGIFVDSQGVLGGEGDAGSVVVGATSIAITDGGQISSSTFGSGNGGSVVINAADAVAIIGNQDSLPFTGIAASTDALLETSVAGGDAGSVIIRANTIVIAGGAQITTSTLGSGNGGDIVIGASTSLEIQGDGNTLHSTGISAESVDGATGNAGKVTIDAGSVTIDGIGQLTSSTEGPGNAGDVTVNAENIALTNGGAIFSNTTGSGDGGNVVVDVAGALAITGDPASELFTGISAESVDGATGNAGKVTIDAASISIAEMGQVTTSTDGPGSAGDVSLNTDSLAIADGAQISSSTSGSGNGGNIVVDVTGTLEIDGGGKPEDATGIVADGGAGNAGTITINAGNVAIEAAGLVSSSTVGSGSGGDIALNADTLTLTQKGQITTNSSGSGVAGDIVIKAQQVIVDDSTISSDSSGKGASGSVTIDPTSIAITNGSTVSAQATGGGASGGVKLVADVITIEGSTVSTESKSGGGGSITITAPVLLQIIDGVVTATVKNGDQNAGNVTIEAGLLILDGSVLSANAFEGNGGNLTVTAKGLIASSDSVLTASSEQGVDGLIDVSTLSDDVTSGLVELSGVLVQDASRLACTVAPSGPQDPFSSVIVHGRGEYDFDPDAPGFASYGAALIAADQAASARRESARASQSGCDR
jgi:filamentous hemagglutinin family protein